MFNWSDPLLPPELAQMVVEKCPNIQILELYCNEKSYLYMPTAASFSGAHAWSCLHELRNLRVLGAGPEVLFGDALALLGSLSRLESLSIFAADHELRSRMINLSSAAISDDCFPALKHLVVYSGPGPIDLVSQFWKIPPLVRKLVSVCIAYQLGPKVNQWNQKDDLVLSICRGSPCITDLHIDLVNTLTRARILDSQTVTELLGQLPLRRLRIEEPLDPSDMIASACEWEQVVLALPNLEYLHMSYPRLKPEDLAMIAKHMPKLRFLAARLERSRWASGVELLLDPRPQVLAASVSSVRLKFQLDHRTLGHNFPTAFARLLCHLWPGGAHCEVLGRYWNKSECSQITLLINESIKELCAPSEVNPPSVDDITEGWKYAKLSRVPWVNTYGLAP